MFGYDESGEEFLLKYDHFKPNIERTKLYDRKKISGSFLRLLKLFD
jgi:hypothetical protein